MRTVDFSTLPDHAENRAALDDALGTVDLGDAKRTDPVDDAAAFGLGFPQNLDDAALRARAEDIREEIGALLPEGATLEFQLADAEADAEGGSPTHLE